MSCNRKDAAARSKISGMSDAKLLTYCDTVHISVDSADLIDELAYRLRKIKRELFEVEEKVYRDTNAKKD